MIKRLFISLDVPELLHGPLIALQDNLKKSNLIEATYIKSEQLHLTLKFIGDVDEEKAERIQQTLMTIKHAPITVSLGEVGVFPAPARVGVIWVALNGTGISELAEELNRRLQDIVSYEHRPFVSHVTLARVKKVEDQERLMRLINKVSLPHTQAVVKEFVLKNSIQSNNGTEHIPLKEYALQ